MYALLNSILDYLAEVTIGVLNHALDTPAINTSVETYCISDTPIVSDYDDIINRYQWVYNRD